MHPQIFKAFNKICLGKNLSGSALEVGATPTPNTLLNLPALKNMKRKVGINLRGPYKYKDMTIIKGNANKMATFKKQSFDIVLSNATLEHDRFFWKTIQECKRVLKPKGLLLIGVPTYINNNWEKALKKLAAIPFLSFLNELTITYKIHEHPGDYYRFSQQAVKQVFFEGMKNIKMKILLTPPRIIGWAQK